MQRDFELIRKLLFFFDDKPGAESVAVPDLGPGYTQSQIKYHLILLYQAGLLDCEPVKSSTSDRIISVIPFYLTWDGHEFLTKIKSDGTWKKIQRVLSSKGGALGFAIINQLATKYALQAVGLHMGT